MEKKNCYMLDTTVYNYINLDINNLEILKKSCSLGFRYYTTEIQNLEITGEGAKTYNRDCVSECKKEMPKEQIQELRGINEILKVEVLPEIASGMRNHTRVDGTNRFLSKESLAGKVFTEIDSKNKRQSKRPFAYSHDAMIAETAIHYGCVLVTDDKELRTTVNSFLECGAISTEELLNLITECSSVKEQGEADTP